jgi:hypothetical protein
MSVIIRDFTLWRYAAIVRRIGPSDASTVDALHMEARWRCGCRAVRSGPQVYRWLRCARHEPIPQFPTDERGHHPP